MAAAETPYDQVVEDMVQGRDFAARLQGLLRDSPEAGAIVDQILQVFARAIDAARDMARGEEGSEVQSEVTCAAAGCGKRKAAGGDRRGGTSRRRTQNSSLVKMVTTQELEDGHSWRKYGQKEIGNCKYPKAYFRCTHKYDQRCVAQRQVQRCDDAPDTFRVTYIGAHTCRDPATLAPPLAAHDASVTDGVLHAGSRLISFVAPNNNNAGGTPTTSTTTNNTTAGNAANNQEAALLLPPLKLEGGGVDQEEVLSSLTPAGSARNPAVATPSGPDQGDVTSDFFGGGAGDLGFVMNDDTFDLEDLLCI